MYSCIALDFWELCQGLFLAVNHEVLRREMGKEAVLTIHEIPYIWTALKEKEKQKNRQKKIPFLSSCGHNGDDLQRGTCTFSYFFLST